MRILVAIDGSPCSNVILDQLARRPWPVGALIKIVTVADPWLPVGTEFWALPPGYYDDLARAAREGAERVLAEALDRFAGRDELAVATEVLSGSPAASIIDEAERWKADLVVVGSHGYGAVKRFLLGSVSHAVALHAPCSVEVVRERQAA